MVVTDPWADPLEVEASYGITLGKIDSKHRVDSLIVGVGHDEFRALDPKALRALCKGTAPVLGDVKSLYDRSGLDEQGFSVFRL